MFPFNLTKLIFFIFFRNIKDVMTKLAAESNLEIIQLDYVQRETRNIKENLCVPRIFLQGKFRKRKT